MDNKLKLLVSEKGLQDCVILTGLRPYNEMPDFIKLADLSLTPFFINPITKDIIPIKVLNCLAGGTPMLCAPIRDVVKHFPEYESGMIYADIANPNNFIEKMIDIISDNALRTRLSHNAIKYIEENFLLDKQIDKLENLLYSVISKHQIIQ